MTQPRSHVTILYRTYILLYSPFTIHLSHRIQAKTDNGDLVIDFLIEVMTDERPDFKICHRLDAAKLLTKYGRDEAIAFILDNPREPSRSRKSSGPSEESEFDIALAKKIRESTDDGVSVVRFLINVMEGELKVFGPQHRMAAARELLSRGFGKHAREEARSSNAQLSSPAPHSSFPRKRESTPSADLPSDNPHSSAPFPSEESQAAIATADPEEEEQEDWARIWEEIEPIIEEAERISAEQPAPEIDPDNPPHVPDFSAFNEAWGNSQKWFEEWKNSIDPEEYQAIIKQTAARFSAKLNMRIERRKQIAADRERREREEAERLAQQSAVADEAEAESEEPPGPRPPTRSQHRRKLMFVLGESIYIDCDHPDCDLHEQDRSRFRGSVQYGAGPTSGHFP